MTITSNLSVQISPDKLAAREVLSKSVSRLNSGGSLFSASNTDTATDTSSTLPGNAQIRPTNQARLISAPDRLAVSKEHLDAATSAIPDADAAEESAQFARENIVAQPGAAMLPQANATPQSALRLLP
jgi:flagellin